IHHQKVRAVFQYGARVIENSGFYLCFLHGLRLRPTRVSTEEKRGCRQDDWNVSKCFHRQDCTVLATIRGFTKGNLADHRVVTGFESKFACCSATSEENSTEGNIMQLKGRKFTGIGALTLAIALGLSQPARANDVIDYLQQYFGGVNTSTNFTEAQRMSELDL